MLKMNEKMNKKKLHQFFTMYPLFKLLYRLLTEVYMKAWRERQLWIEKRKYHTDTLK